MIFCLALYFIYAISLMMTSLALFKLSPSMIQWIDRIQSSTKNGLIDVAQLSDADALKGFKNYFLGGAFFSFILYVFFDKIDFKTAKQVSAITFLMFFYTAGSIGAWAYKRTEIFEKFISDTKRDVGRAVKYIAAFFVILNAAFISYCYFLSINELSSIPMFMVYSFLAVVVVVFSVITANTLSVFFIFAPALAAIAYLRGIIFSAKIVLIVGKDNFFNFLVFYGIFFTLYLAFLSFPNLRSVFSFVPIICQ